MTAHFIVRKAWGMGLVLLVLSTPLPATTLTPSEPQGRRPVVDQSNTEVLSSLINGGSSAYRWEQGITAGVSGRLTQITLYVGLLNDVGETAPTRVWISLGAAGQSGDPVWTTTDVLDAGWHTFHVTNARIFFTAGEEYTIGIQGQSANDFNPGFGISYNDQYPAGHLFLNGSIVGSEANDLLFQTYVQPDLGLH